MSKTKLESFFVIKKETVFQLFKYSVYFLLSMNIFYFFAEEYAASNQTFYYGVELFQLIEAFTATIDTAAWVVLLLLFELETYILDDAQIKGWVKWSIDILSVICYVFIIYSFYGYVAKYIMLSTFIPFSIDDVCSLVGGKTTYIDKINDYLLLTKEACVDFNSAQLYQVVGTEIISTEQNLYEAQKLGLLDVVNSGNWLIIVALLEMDVYLQLRGKLTERIVYYSSRLKLVLYSILLLAAIYWGANGEFLDFWDAFLWIIAFAFIELNVFEWNAETREESSKTKTKAEPPSVNES